MPGSHFWQNPKLFDVKFQVWCMTQPWKKYYHRFQNKCYRTIHSDKIDINVEIWLQCTLNSTHKFISLIKYRHSIQFKCTLRKTWKKKWQSSVYWAKWQFDLWLREKEESKDITCKSPDGDVNVIYTWGEKTETFTFYYRRGRIRKYLKCSPPPRVKTPACSHFYCLISLWPLGGLSHWWFQFMKWMLALGRQRATKPVKFWQVESAIAATSSI